ncbi:MAG: GtrA family protein [Anaerolineales bacterium]
MISTLQEFKRNNRKEIERFLKFSVVGFIGFIVDTGTLNLLVGVVGLDTNTLRLVAKTISFTLALISNFLWNRFWTYPDSRSKPIRKQLAQFFIVNLAGLALNLLIFGFTGNALVPRMQAMFGPGPGLLIGTNLAQVCAVTVVLFWNFFVNRVWTYNDVS